MEDDESPRLSGGGIHRFRIENRLLLQNKTNKKCNK